MLNGGIDVTENSQLYLTGLAAYNKANESFNYRSPIGAQRDSSTLREALHNLGANGASPLPSS